KAHVRLAKFALGDFVLLGKIIKFPNKLALNWKGPYREWRVDSDYVMEVQQLVEPFRTSDHHASRLKFFSDAALDVSDDLVDYAAFGDEGFLSKNFCAIAVRPTENSKCASSGRASTT
ncbi:hypothetical protein DYB26_006568, partial [Aphanomyces astaci]